MDDVALEVVGSVGYLATGYKNIALSFFLVGMAWHWIKASGFIAMGNRKKSREMAYNVIFGLAIWFVFYVPSSFRFVTYGSFDDQCSIGTFMLERFCHGTDVLAYDVVSSAPGNKGEMIDADGEVLSRKEALWIFCKNRAMVLKEFQDTILKPENLDRMSQLEKNATERKEATEPEKVGWLDKKMSAVKSFATDKLLGKLVNIGTFFQRIILSGWMFLAWLCMTLFSALVMLIHYLFNYIPVLVYAIFIVTAPIGYFTKGIGIFRKIVTQMLAYTFFKVSVYAILVVTFMLIEMNFWQALHLDQVSDYAEENLPIGVSIYDDDGRAVLQKRLESKTLLETVGDEMVDSGTVMMTIAASISGLLLAALLMILVTPRFTAQIITVGESWMADKLLAAPVAAVSVAKIAATKKPGSIPLPGGKK